MPKPTSLSELDSNQRRNGLLIIAGQTSSKLGDLICSAKTVLTWLMGVVGAPPALTALLVPIRESGSMLPQAFISGFVKRARKRKRIYAIGAIGQALCLGGMGLAAFFLKGAAAGWAIVVALVFLSLARCLCSIASKDVLGKSIPKGARGKVTGTASSISGFLGLGAALILTFGSSPSGSQSSLGWIILGGGVCYLIASSLIRLVEEEDSPESKAGFLSDIKSRFLLIWNDRIFRNFVIARSLLLGSALSSPYLVLLSQQNGLDLGSLAAFVIAGGLATAVSSPIWGSLSDRSARYTMMIGGILAGLFGFLGVITETSLPSLAGTAWIWPALFFLLNLGYSGVRIGRKIYVVDICGGEKRTDYVSASNTVIAFIILALGGIASLLHSLNSIASLGFFSLLCVIGGIFVLRLPDTHAPE